MGSLDVLGEDEDLVTRVDLGWLNMLFVRGSLVVFLGSTEGFSWRKVKFVEISSELSCMKRCNIMFWVDVECRVVALLGEGDTPVEALGALL